MPPADVELLRGLYDLHNEAGADFPDLLARDYLRADAEFVEFATSPSAATYRGREAVADLFRDRFRAGAMQVEGLTLTALGDRRVLAAFRVRMRGTRSGAETSMQLWNLVTLDGPRIARIEEFSDEGAALAAAER